MQGESKNVTKIMHASSAIGIVNNLQKPETNTFILFSKLNGVESIVTRHDHPSERENIFFVDFQAC